MRVREVIDYKHYFLDFFKAQRRWVQDKILWTFRLIEFRPRIPETYLKHIESVKGLYKIRIQAGSDIFRIFYFFDKDKIIILANGFQKKTQKTPVNEIEKAISIKWEYEHEDK